MKATPKKICLLTTGHLTNSPRLIKEARAFQYYGYDVIVVACSYDSTLSTSDRRITELSKWCVYTISWNRADNPRLFWGSRIRRVACHILARFLRKIGSFKGLEWLEIRAFDRVLPEIMGAARKVNADLFVGHSPGVLPIAWKVAKEVKAKCGFDAEDFYSGMKRRAEKITLWDEVVCEWERCYLNRYDYLTTAAPLIAHEYGKEYSVSFDAIVLNTFDPVRVDEGRAVSAKSALSLFWVSQTIGAHRGLEDIVKALALMKELAVVVFLCGQWQRGYETRLRALADSLFVPQNKIVAVPRIEFDDLVASSSRYDVGLALEEPTSRNREICLTNKILMYLSAGLAVAATATPAQTNFMDKIPEAGFVYPWGDHHRLAEKLSTWIEHPNLLNKAKNAAFQAAQDQFCWELEREKLTTLAANVLR